MSTFYELGHFYTDESINKTSLDYLYNIPVKSEGIFSFFIDNFNSTNDVLDYSLLLNTGKEVFNTDIELFFEKDMINYYDNTLDFLSPNDLVITKYQRGKVEKQELAIGDYRITLAEVFPTFKPTCAMLSFTWTLFRLGMFDNKKSNNDVMTCIHQQYESVEKKVQLMLEYIKQNCEIKHNVEYHFYQ